MGSVGAEDSKKAEKPKKSIIWNLLGVLFIIGLIQTIVSDCGGSNEDSVPSEASSSVVASSTTSAPTTTVTPTTTVAPTTTEDTPSVIGLPVYPDPNSVLIAQRLLVALGEPVVVDGVWGPATEEALNDLRSEYGLNEGGLDEEMWQALFLDRSISDNRSWREPSSSRSLEGLVVPSTAVLIEENSGNRGSILESAEYVLPHYVSKTQVEFWYREQYFQEDIDSWNWCTKKGSIFYWSRGRVTSLSDEEPLIPNGLRVDIRNRGNGRVDIHVDILDWRPTDFSDVKCDRLTTTPATTTPIWESSPLMRCEIGQHLPSCLALAGVSNFTYNDCVDVLYDWGNRGIDFQENWYVWDVYDDKLTVSLSPYGCL